MKKAIIILMILILSLLYYTGVLTRKETLPFSKEFFSVESLIPWIGYGTPKKVPLPAQRSWIHFIN